MTFAVAWREAPLPVRRCLELAYQSLADGGLPVGSVLTDAGGAIVAEGRNRAYDPPGGPDALQGTPLAHAEMNALAAARTAWDLSSHTMWSTQEPCSMCASAIAFTGVGAVRFLAPDPWSLATGGLDRAFVPTEVVERTAGPAEDLWLVFANVLFLLGIASKMGIDHPTVSGNRELEPETAAIVLELIVEGLTAPMLTFGRTLDEVLADHGDRIAEAAEARTRRTTGF